MLILPKYPVEGASSRYCAYQFIPYFESRGIACTVRPFMDADFYALSLKPGNNFRKLTKFIAALIDRISVVASCRKYDVVFMHRELVPVIPAFLERFIKWQSVPIVFIYDDALFLLKENRSNPVLHFLKRTFFSSSAKMQTLFGLSNCAIGTNPYLASKAAEWCAVAHYLEIPEDLASLPAKIYPAEPGVHQNHPVVIGWLGSPSTEKYLHLLDTVFSRLAVQHEFVLKIIGGGEYRHEALNVVHERWQLQTQTRQLHSFDIGIMPLPDEEWSLGKSGGKARTYMAAGLPLVASSIGYCRDLIRHGHAGLLVSNEDEWVSGLSALICDAAERQRLGCNARTHLENHLNLTTQAERLLQMIEDAVREKK